MQKQRRAPIIALSAAGMAPKLGISILEIGKLERALEAKLRVDEP